MDWSLWTPKTTPPLVSHKRYSSPVTTLLWTITVDTKNHSTTGLTQKVDSLPVSTLLWTDHCGHRKPLHHRSHTKARLSACHNPAVDWSLWTPKTSPPLIPRAETFCFLAGWLIWHLHAQLITGNLCSSPTTIVNWNNLLEGLATNPALKLFQTQRSALAKTGRKTPSCLLTYSTCQQQQKSFSVSTDTSEEKEKKRDFL